MKNETLERELKSQLDRWGGEDMKLAQGAGKMKTGNTLPSQKRAPGVTVLALGRDAAAEVVEDDEVADDPLFVRAPSIDIWGAWRRAFHCNGWWVVGHYLMHPCNSEREADRLCNTLQANWDES
jgi:hypothetical protein